MGTKPTRKWKHLYRSVAFLILCLIAACTPIRMWSINGYECDHLRHVEHLISRQDFEGAMKESQQILDQSPKSYPGDKALMSLGLISAHHANPNRDYTLAMEYFKRLEKDFPQSPLAEETKIWISVLQSFQKAEQVDIEIQKKKDGLER